MQESKESFEQIEVTRVHLIITTTQARNYYAYEVNVFSETDNLHVRSLARLGLEPTYSSRENQRGIGRSQIYGAMPP